LFVCSLHSQGYDKLKFFDFFTNQIDTLKGTYDMSFHKDELYVWYGVIGSSVVLWYYDEDLVDLSKDFFKDIGVDSTTSQESFFCFVDDACLNFPNGSGAYLYFIGDGLLHLGIAGGFLVSGLIFDNTKSKNVASQIVESMLAGGLVTQTIKHITGRETPFKQTEYRGKWDFFPNQIDYHQEIPKYDAYPSGHIAALTSTITVLQANYPQHTGKIITSGLILGSALMIEMQSRGVHWASDYPLGIALGYYFGRYVSSREIDKGYNTKNSINLTPIISMNGDFGIGLEKRF